MKCINCGTLFDPEEILLLGDNAELLCDICAFEEDHYIITYDGSEYMVKADDIQEAVEKWKAFVERKHTMRKGEFAPTKFDVRKIDYVINDFD